jgi:hypothetical protein
MRSIRHPVAVLSRTKRGILFAAALVLTCVLFPALQSLNAPLETPAARWGILSLEMSSTSERSREIVGSWDLSARENAKSGLLLDFLFPLCYATTLTVACFWAAGMFRARGYRMTGGLSALVAWGQWPAAALDYVENIAMWMEVRGSLDQPWPRIAATCATIKFVLILAGLAILVAALIVWALRRRARGPAL